MIRSLRALLGALIVLAGAATLVVSGAGQATAQPGGYGPVAPAAVRDLGLSGPVLVTRTVGPAGDTLVARDDDVVVELHAPPGTLPAAGQVTVRRVVDAEGAGALGRGEELLAGWSVSVTRPDGSPWRPEAARPRGSADARLRLSATGPVLSGGGLRVLRGGEGRLVEARGALRAARLDLVLPVGSSSVLVVGPRPSGPSDPRPASGDPAEARGPGGPVRVAGLPGEGDLPVGWVAAGALALLAGTAVAVGRRR